MNNEVSRQRQRYCHTSEYHTKYLICEAQEELQRRLNEIKERYSERYAKIVRGVGAVAVTNSTLLKDYESLDAEDRVSPKLAPGSMHSM